ncbi:MAG: ATP-grasp domain-containing protein [Dehalococcoidia bacterium]|nr:ATP-grasp domain-containing protein [Dehalococcoidia bacterium]MDD5493283.1 ATP-grasp domain-containing protein [Dehalococcoidia bacterium]
MPLSVAIIYNDPFTDIPNQIGESEAIVGVLEEVVAVKKALLELGHTVQQVPLHRPLDNAINTLASVRADLIFNIFEGFDDDPSSEPVIARWMEDREIRFTGNPSHVLELTLDKVRTKLVLNKVGIKTPLYQLLNSATLTRFNLEFPCIVKPQSEDASHGLLPESVVSNVEQLANQVERVSNSFGGIALVEEFVDGREFNASVLGNETLSLVEISEITYSLPPGLPRLLTFESKWFEETEYYAGTGVTCPAPIDSGLKKTISDIVLKGCTSVGCRGYARVDMRQDPAGDIKVLEINANPDISPELGIARQAEAIGLTYTQLIEKIVNLALE